MKRATSLVLALAGGEVPGTEAEGPAAVTVTSEPMDACAACAAGYQVSYVEACGAFAAMLSGYVFGPSGNPARKLEDNAQVRPGDIVFRINPDGSTARVDIAMTTAHYEGGLPCVQTAGGNVGGKVRWFDTAPNCPVRMNAGPRRLGGSIRVIYTRCPE